MKTKDVVIKILVELSRFILGATFIFSGFVKAVDPFGTAYKIEDYLSAFNLSSLSFLAMPGSFLLCALEFLMGVFMLLGIYRRWNSRLMLITMCLMTPLTLYLAIANPVEDCGCFGDVLVISNWQTFYKNIVLLACSVFVLIYRERIGNFFTGKTYWLAFLYIVFFTILFIFRNYYLDPLFDFRPYRIGANIPELMKVEKGKERIVENIMIYEKDGVEKEFTEDNYPWEDETWKFVRIDTKIVKQGEEPKIHDFTINKLTFDNNLEYVLAQEDITEEVLTDSNYVFLMITPSLTRMNTSYLSNLEDVAHYAYDYHYKFYCLTSSVTDEIMAWEKDNVSNFDYALTDERTLKTIIRTNPGLLLLKNGIIINKWPDIFVPAEENLNKPLVQLKYSHMIDQKAKDKQNLIYVILIFVVPLLILKGLDVLFYRRRKSVQGNENPATEDIGSEQYEEESSKQSK